MHVSAQIQLNFVCHFIYILDNFNYYVIHCCPRYLILFCILSFKFLGFLTISGISSKNFLIFQVLSSPVPKLHCWCWIQEGASLEVGLTTTTGRRVTWLVLFLHAKSPYQLHWMHLRLNVRHIECTSRWMYVKFNACHIEEKLSGNLDSAIFNFRSPHAEVTPQ